MYELTGLAWRARPWRDVDRPRAECLEASTLGSEESGKATDAMLAA